MSPSTCSNCGAHLAGTRGTCGVCSMPFGEASFSADGGRLTPEVSVPPPKSLRALALVRTAVVAVVGVLIGVFIGRHQAAEVIPDDASAPVAPAVALAERSGAELAAPSSGESPVAPALDPLPTETASVEPALSASFEFHAKAPASGDGFYVLGVVANHSPVAIARPELVIVFLDTAGKEIGTDHGFAIDEVVEPGARSYLSAIVTDPPSHAELRYEVVPRPVGFRSRSASGLRVEAGEMRREGSILRFWGQVHNDGLEPASFVEVTVVAFDAQDKLLGIHSGYAKGEVLAPGNVARFEVSAVLPAPARVEYLVAGMVR